jgi:hypothetical protein
MADANLEMLRRVAKAVRDLDVPVVYLGGATIALYLDAYAASHLRVTLDVDCIVAASTLAEYQALEARLRSLGLRRLDEDAPICRWTYHRRPATRQDRADRAPPLGQ